MTREDFLREQRIGLLWFDLIGAKTPEARREAMERMQAEAKERTAERVSEMELEKGIFGMKVIVSASGSMLKGICPFHAEKTPSLLIDRDKNSYKCLGCGASGSVAHVHETDNGMVATISTQEKV